MFSMRYAAASDRDFWFTLDAHLPAAQYDEKACRHESYILLSDGQPVGVLRYNLFWDSVPFLTMIYLAEGARRKGLGREAMLGWERDMGRQGFDLLMTSTQADEAAQHFYRSLGYKDCGCLVMDIPGYEQPLEVFFAKKIDPDKKT